MILANGCNITKSEKFKGVWILSIPTVIYIYIYIYIYTHTHIHGSTIRTARWPGASVKDARDSTDLSLARSGHCSVVTKLYHLHALLSLVNLIIKAIKKHLGAKDNSFHLHAVFCSVWTARAQTAASLTRASCLQMGKYIQKYVKIPLLASNLNND